MGPINDADNLEAPENNEVGQEEEVETEETLPENEDEGQGEGTGTEEPSEGQEEDTSLEDEDAEGVEEEDSKGIANDPKLLKKRLTEKSEEFAEYKREAERRIAELANPPAPKETDRKKLLADGRIPPEELTKEDMATMTPQQYTRYLTNVAKLEVQKEFNQTYAPTLKQTQIDSAKATLKEFFATNPGSKELKGELKDVMVSYAQKKVPLQLSDAWDIVKGRHPEIAEKKIRDQNTLKKKANMIKDSGTPPSRKVVVKDKPTGTEAVNAAFDQLGIK